MRVFSLSPKSLVLMTLTVALATASSAAQDLRVFRTVHYRIHTDLDADLSDDLGHRMDVMYDEYGRRVAEFSRPSDAAPLEVYLVHSQTKYLHLVGLTMGGSGGAFNFQRHLLASYLDGQGREGLRRTLQHEAFHQFAAETIGQNLPIWLNEGLAQIFEEGIWTGDGFKLGEVPPRRLRQLTLDIQNGSLFDFSRMLAMTPMEWALRRRDPIQGTLEYNQAWAMTHFLIYATDENGNPKYRARLIEMLKLLKSGDDGETAFSTAFSDNIAGFQTRFLEFAAELHPTPLATLMENQSVLGDLLVALKNRGQKFDSLNDFRTACVFGRWTMHYRRANLQWQSAPDPSVYFQTSDGQPFTDDQEHFELSGDGPLDDLVCRADGMPPLRTHFYQADEKIEHETVVDTQDAQASVNTAK